LARKRNIPSGPVFVVSYRSFVILALILPVAVYGAHAQECKQLCVAKQFYEEGETVVISGQVDVVLEKTPIIIQILHDKTIVDIAQEEVAQDGSYTVTFKAEGDRWKNDGKYTAKATYGPTGNVYEVSFDFQTKESAKETREVFEVKAGNAGTFDVPYTIKGGTIKDIVVDPQILGLVVTIQSTDDGSLTLDLGRKWIDAKKSDGTDDTYIIYIDGLEVAYEESAVDGDSRIIEIQFQEGDSDIEIIGTQVIPEFGSIALVVLVVSIASVILVSQRTLRFN
jgi:predicted secreted protein with PEFG-CTERM motif